MAHTYDVAGVGTNSVDEILQLPADIGSIASIGKARIASAHLLVGGQTATVTAACAALKLRARYIGAFGSHDRGLLARHALQSRGVEVAYAVERDAPNRGAVILVDPSGDRTVLWQRDDRLKLMPAELSPEALAARVVHVDDDDAEIARYAAELGRRAQAMVTSDIEHASDGVEPLVSAVTHPIFARALAVELTGEQDPERALRKLRRLNGGLLCVTLGADGAAALDGDRFHHAPAVPVDVVDTTGAGDVFRAGVIYGLLQGWAVPEMLRFATAAAALACTRLGAMPSVPHLEDVRQFLNLR